VSGLPPKVRPKKKVVLDLKVKDQEGRPVPGAMVVLRTKGFQAQSVSDDNGEVSFSFTTPAVPKHGPSQSVTVQTSLPGFLTSSRKIAVVGNAPKTAGSLLCFGKVATIVGTPGADTPIYGTSGNDVIVGRAGDDQIDGLGGNDLICGGEGNDQLLGRAGNDKLDGGPGFDYVDFRTSTAGVHVDMATGVATGEGSDTITGSESVIGSPFDDTIHGNGALNVLFGMGGNDRLSGGGGGDATKSLPDVLIGGAGDDRLDGTEGYTLVNLAASPGGVTVDLAAGTAVGDGNDTLVGIAAVTGTPQNDVLQGDQGDNVFLPLAGNDTVDGRGGSDTIMFVGSAGPVVADLQAGTASGEGADTLAGIENVAAFSSFDDQITGNSSPNVISTNDGNDTIAGLAGDDVLNGGDGIDSLNGGDGTDTCLGGETLTACESTSPGSAARTHMPWGLRAPSLPRLPGTVG
jgi:Ca2+-binding RTX toxin-like protein